MGFRDFHFIINITNCDLLHRGSIMDHLDQ